jgi:hypothetical protein
VATDDRATTNIVRGEVTRAALRADERTTLMGVLQRQRDLIAWKVRDIPDVTLRSVSMPSGLTGPGIIRHLENVERSWFRETFAGETGLTYDWTDEDPNAEFHPPDDVPVSSLLAAYAEEQGRCDAVIMSAPSLDQVGVTRDVSLRWIVTHLIEETARHLGQLDLLRELADGEVGEEPE